MRAYQRVVEPKYRQAYFNCPHCGALAEQYWTDPIENDPEIGEFFPINGYAFSRCRACRALALWQGNDYVNEEGGEWSVYRLVYPAGQSGPPAHPDMPASIVTLFDEASSILHLSPRASAALSRLCLEQLCNELDAKGRNLVKKIEWLSKNRKLDTHTQQLLDIVRNYGNDAVHTSGEILMLGNSSDAASLLELVNELVERLIAIPKHTAAMMDRVPEERRAKIIEHTDD